MSEMNDKSNVSAAAGRATRLAVIAALSALMCAVVLLSGCASGSSGVPGSSCPAASGPNYVIGSGDVLQVSVWQQEKLNQTLTVRPDGRIAFPLIGTVNAAGLTPTQLAYSMTKQLRRYLSSPQVSVIVKAANSFQVSVLGEVHKPGRYHVTSNDTSVLDVLAEAGGFTSYADKDSIGVMRHGPKGTSRIHFRYFKAISDNPGSSNFCVRPGDTVIVP